MVAAGRLYTVHCLWWGRRKGRDVGKGKGGGGLFMLPSAPTQQRDRGEGRDVGSSCTAQEKEEVEAGLPSLCMQINRIPQHRCHMTAEREAGACTALTERGCVSSAMMSWFILRKWCQASAVRLVVSTVVQKLDVPALCCQVQLWYYIDYKDSLSLYTYIYIYISAKNGTTNIYVICHATIFVLWRKSVLHLFSETQLLKWWTGILIVVNCFLSWYKVSACLCMRESM